MSRQITRNKPSITAKNAPLSSYAKSQLEIDGDVDDHTVYTEHTAFIDGQEQQTKADDYPNRLLKYIPAEVVSLYIFLDGVIRTQDSYKPLLDWGIFLFCIFVTPLYLNKIAKVIEKRQLVISTLSFCVWVFGMGGPFDRNLAIEPIYGALLLPCFTFLIPLLDHDAPPSGTAGT